MTLSRPSRATTRVELGEVARTLLVPLWARAEESLREAPLVTDAKARSIVDALDFDFGVLRDAQASQLGCCVRAQLVDQWVREFLHAHPEGTVIELGVGLNARFERLDNDRAHWIELDLPDVTALRERFFTPHPRRTIIAGSITERDVIASLSDLARGPCMVVSEGVLVYLREAEVRDLFARLRAALPGAWFVFDAMTAHVVRLQRAHDAMRHFDAQFSWELARPSDVERFAEGVVVERTSRFFDMLYAHPQRLPRWMQVAGPWVSRAWPRVREVYTINLARLGDGRCRP